MLTIIKKIKPSDRERALVSKKVNSFLSQLKQALPGLKPELAGSFAKDTWLSGDHDIDIFIKFPYKKYHSQDISKLLERKLTAHTKVHGSRDYFQVQSQGYMFELIPVLDINSAEKAKNVTDVSPLHSIWVKKHIKGKADEIRLVKQFTKANNLYGAESYIKGFSGYLLEVLTIHYKGFNNFIKKASQWSQEEIIDPEKNYKNKAKIKSTLNPSKHSHLIVIDPVQKSRNIAAALSEKKYKEFISICNKFLHNPSTSFFEKKKFSLSELKQPGENVIYIELQPLQGKKDIVACKILKVLDFLKDRMELNSFKVKDLGFEFDKIGRIWLILENELLSETRKHYGPFLKDTINLKKFKEKWHKHKLYEESGRAYIRVKREFRTPGKFAKHVLEQDYCKENYKKILKIKTI